jgi:hypothetical protein
MLSKSGLENNVGGVAKALRCISRLNKTEKHIIGWKLGHTSSIPAQMV